MVDMDMETPTVVVTDMEKTTVVDTDMEKTTVVDTDMEKTTVDMEERSMEDMATEDTDTRTGVVTEQATEEATLNGSCTARAPYVW